MLNDISNYLLPSDHQMRRFIYYQTREGGRHNKIQSLKEKEKTQNKTN